MQTTVYKPQMNQLGCLISQFASNSMHPVTTLELVFVAIILVTQPLPVVMSVGFSAVFDGSICVVGLDTHSIKSFINVSTLQD